MTSIDSDSDGAKYMGSSKSLIESIDSKAEEISWLIDNLPVTVFRVSSGSSWDINYVSKNVERLTGYSNTSFIDRKLSWSDIVFHEDIPIVDKVVQKAIKTKTPYQVEYRIKKSDGNTVFIQEQGYFVKDESGNLACINGVFLDLTPQIRRRDESERAIVKGIPEPSFAVYVDASGKVKYINDYFVKVCKFKSADAVVGLTSAQLLDTNSQKTLADKVMETGEGVYNIEKSFKFKALDKPLHTVLSAVPIRDESGSIVGSLTVMTDMTEMKEKEQEIQNLLDYTNSCLKDLGEGIRNLGEGNLDIYLEKIKDDEFGKTYDEFNKLGINLKSLVKQNLEYMNQTLEEAQQLEEAVTQMNTGIQQVSTAAEQIATGSENLSRHAGTAASEVKASGEIFKKLSQSSAKSANYASQAGKTSEETKGLGNMAIEDLAQFVEEISRLGTIVQSLDNAVNNIGAVTGKIKSIADQTNLLALNAAIEAARAGEHGRGFAVVADEVRKLAADSRKSTDDINEIVTGVQKETKKVTEAIDRAQVSAGTGNKNIKQALDKINDVANAVNTINTMLAELDKLSDAGLEKIESIDKSISEAASTAEENAASSEETSAAIEEQTAAMQQVSTSVQNVSILAQKTTDMLMENFKFAREEDNNQKPSQKPQVSSRKGSPIRY